MGSKSTFFLVSNFLVVVVVGFRHLLCFCCMDLMGIFGGVAHCHFNNVLVDVLH